MERRDVLGLMGAAAASMATGSTCRADHPDRAPADDRPIDEIHLYLCAFHLAKANPRFQVEAHHYCSAVSDEVHQCVIYDSTGKNAKILGVEYIISDRLYKGLPDTEKKYYHPHNYEIIAGLLVAPGMANADEDKLMSNLVTTWGKTWHTWPDPKTPLPMGDPLLMWSFSKDGQINEEMLAARDRRMKMSTPAVRKRRTFLGPVPSADFPKSIDDAAGR